MNLLNVQKKHMVIGEDDSLDANSVEVIQSTKQTRINTNPEKFKEMIGIESHVKQANVNFFKVDNGSIAEHITY